MGAIAAARRTDTPGTPGTPDAGDLAEAAGRAGLVARGVIYVVVAILGARIALRSGDAEQADHRGAIEEVADQPFGRPMLVALAVGFASYALWRLVRAVRGEERGDPPALRQRLADLFRVALHAGLCVSTVALLRGRSSGGGNQQQAWTARFMAEPWGRWLVAAAGLAVIGGGLWLVARGFREGFRKHLERLAPWVVRLGKAGHVGRGLAFAFIGGFVVRAALRFDPNEPIGLDAALRDLAGSGWGRVVALLVSLGLGLFGLFSMAEARDRRVLGG